MRYSFGEHTLDLVTYQLRRGEAPVELQPKVFDALIHLIERRDRVVTKDELLAALWPPNITESVLPRCISALRKGLGDDDGAIIATVRGRGYRFVADVVVRRPIASAVPPSQRSGAMPAWQTTPSGRLFVGRDAIIATLEATLDSAIEGRGRTLVFSGPRGIGKSRTIGIALRAAHKRSARVVSVAGSAQTSSGARSPWVQIARRVAKGDPDLQNDLASDVHDHALRERMTHAICHHAEERGLVLIIDDLHLVDEPTLTMFTHVSSRIATERVMLLAALREHHLRAEDPLAQTIAALSRQAATCQRIRLGGLGEREIARLITHVRRSDPPEGLADELLELTGGNPFYADELIQWLAQHGWDPSMLRQPPVAVRAAVGLQIEPLVAPTRGVIELAAVAGGTLSVDVAAAVLSMSPNEVRRAWEEAHAAGLASGANDHAVELSPPIVALAVAEDLDVAKRQDLHRALAAALEEKKSAARASHHLLRTGDGGDRRRGLLLALDAAEAEGSIDALQGVASRLSDEDPLLPRALLALAKVSNRQTARDHLRRAIALTKRRDDGVLLARIAIQAAEPFEPSPVIDHEVLTWLEDARDGCDDAALRSHLSALCGTPEPDDQSLLALRAAFYAASIPSRQPEHVRIAAALPESDPHALFVKLSIQLAADDLAAARETAQRLGAVARPPWQAAWARASCALADGMIEEAEAALPPADAHPFAPTIRLALSARAKQLSGNWEELAEIATRLGRESRWAQPLAAAWRARSFLETNRPDDARRALSGELKEDVHLLARAALLAEVADGLSDRDAAARIATAIAPHAERAASHDVLRLHFGSVSFVLGRLALCMGDAETARGHLEAAARRADDTFSPLTGREVAALLSRARS